MDNLAQEITFILLLLIVNGVFAMVEIAVVSARKARLQQLADEGNTQAGAALKLASHPNQFLATVQVGITLVGILAGAFGGATIAESLSAYISTIPSLTPYAEAIGVVIVVISITYFSLVIGELVPKRLALNHPEPIAAAFARPMQILSVIASPVVWLLDVSTNSVIRLLGIKPSTQPSITPEEIKVLIQQGTDSGVFEEVEQEMIEGVLHIGDRRVEMLMTPRTQVFWLDIEDRPDTILQKLTSSQRSRFPVVKDNLDNVLGIVRAKDLLAQSLSGNPLDLQALLRPVPFVPETMPALRVLELFKQKGAHIALVTDEYGVVQGLVTHNDILESIVGDFPSAGEASEPQAIQREDGSLLIDGLMPIDQFKEVIGHPALPEEEYGGYQTVGGFIINHLGSIPKTGQYFEWGNLRFEVIDMDGRRVDKILVIPLPADQDDAEP